MNIKEIVNDPEWQSLRQSFVGTWKIFPERNCKYLKRYLGDFSDPLKLRRVLNYLTGSGFRSGKIKHPEITELINKIKEAKNE
jgi:hypothetical protein